MSRFILEFSEALRIAIEQVRSNKLRSALTALGVIIGIISITLMGTAVLGIRSGLQEALSKMGDDSLFVTRQPWKFGPIDWDAVMKRKRIDLSMADKLNTWSEQQPWGLIKRATPTMESGYFMRRGDNWLERVRVLGAKADYAGLQNVELSAGRFFTDDEAERGANVIVIGHAVAAGLFPGESPLGQRVNLRRKLYTVVGVIKKEGGWMGGRFDQQVMIPLRAFLTSFGARRGMEMVIVKIDVERKAEAVQELRAAVRLTRGLDRKEKDDFAINDQEGLMKEFDAITAVVVMSGFFITGLALFVGAIGIMNITYVSVKERTQEIGTRKALGARRQAILLQFLVEAVTICLVGGVIGLAMTFGATQVAKAIAPEFPVVFSPLLVVAGLGVSMLTGVLSGFAPALQASKLDPVVALRYE